MSKLLDLLSDKFFQLVQERQAKKYRKYSVASMCDCSAHDITVIGMAHAVDCPMAD